MLVRAARIYCSAGVLKQSMLRANSWIIETCRYTVSLKYLAMLVLQEVALHTMQHTFSSMAQCRGMFSTADSFSTSLDAVKLNFAITNERIKRTYSIASSTNARDNCIRQPV